MAHPAYLNGIGQHDSRRETEILLSHVGRGEGYCRAHSSSAVCVGSFCETSSCPEVKADLRSTHRVPVFVWAPQDIWKFCEGLLVGVSWNTCPPLLPHPVLGREVHCFPFLEIPSWLRNPYHAK